MRTLWRQKKLQAGWEHGGDLEPAGLQAFHPRLHGVTDLERCDTRRCTREQDVARLQGEQLQPCNEGWGTIVEY